jgi:hypothetical protein
MRTISADHRPCGSENTAAGSLAGQRARSWHTRRVSGASVRFRLPSSLTSRRSKQVTTKERRVMSDSKLSDSKLGPRDSRVSSLDGAAGGSIRVATRQSRLHPAHSVPGAVASHRVTMSKMGHVDRVRWPRCGLPRGAPARRIRSGAAGAVAMAPPRADGIPSREMRAL